MVQSRVRERGSQMSAILFPNAKATQAETVVRPFCTSKLKAFVRSKVEVVRCHRCYKCTAAHNPSPGMLLSLAETKVGIRRTIHGPPGVGRYQRALTHFMRRSECFANVDEITGQVRGACIRARCNCFATWQSFATTTPSDGAGTAMSPRQTWAHVVSAIWRR